MTQARFGSRVRLVVGATAVVWLAVAALASSASATAPWWHLTSGSRPGHLANNGTAKDEEQEMVVSATEGDFWLYAPNPANKRGIFEEEVDAPLKFDATNEEVQTVLEGLYGAGAVEVTEGEAETAELHTWKVKYVGNLSGKQVPLVETHEYESFTCSFLSLCPLKGGSKEPPIEARELTRGEFRNAPQLVITATNLGDAAVDGTGGQDVMIADKLPHGIHAIATEAVSGSGYGTDGPVECAATEEEVVCAFAGRLSPFDQIEVRIAVLVDEGEGGAVSGEQNEVAVSGGGAATASIQRPIVVSREPTPFGVENYEVTTEEEGGGPATQAGSHPFQVTGTLTMNQLAGPNMREAGPVELPRDIATKLPPGLVGNPTLFAKCTVPLFFAGKCPQASVIGVAVVTGFEPLVLNHIETLTVPIVNLEPAAGEPARFGFLATKAAAVFIDASVRSGGDYGITLSSSTITQTAAFLGFEVTFWGIPGDSRHDNSRGFGCLEDTRSPGVSVCNNADEERPAPFLALPTSCDVKMQTSGEVDSWVHPEPAGERSTFAGQPMAQLTGCNRLTMAPSLKTVPDVARTSSAAGLTVDTHIPQDALTTANVNVPATVRDLTVQLPEGVTLNPAGANGLDACSEGLVGFTGFGEPDPGLTMPLFTPVLPAPVDQGANFCSDASKIGAVKIVTPLLPNPLEGFVYVAKQEENPFGSLIAMYIVAEDPVSGTLVKLPGRVNISGSGRITATFENLPAVPFEDAEVRFFGGAEAALTTPSRCGDYVTAGTIVPWSAVPGEAPTETSSRFAIGSGPGGSVCPVGPLPFSLTVMAGSTNLQAGGFTPFTVTIARADGEQHLQGVQVQMPKGLLGVLKGVPLCAEQQANEGACGQASLIGESTATAGVGSTPITVAGGKVYLTGPYAGAPFGLSIISPVKAGPFDLENTKTHRPACDCVVVRAKIEVDPQTAQITVTADSGGPYAIPRMIEGIPLEIRSIRVTVNRPDFVFDPTNCERMGATATSLGDEGASPSVTVPFTVANCANLAFKPSFKVSTSGKTSRSQGASLHVKLAYPSAPLGTEANIRSVHVELPKALPSRLSTLNHACPDSVFNRNPVDCSPQSRVGFAKAITPVLPVPLEGPAYFVSHGGQKFPELIVVLQGYGLTIDLAGETFISKAGVTSSTFNTVPDVPVSSFELTLPEGPFSALAANRDLCTTSLAMPTTFTGQNGAVLKQNTKVAVTGCQPTIRVLRHSVRGGVATLTVSVPAAGRLRASGAGLTSATKHVRKAGTATISLSLSAGERRFLAGHPGRRLRTAVKLSFVPRHGKPLRAGVTVLIG